MSMSILSRGFTLIELMIGIVVLAIAITLAAPSFESVIANNRSITLSNDLVMTLLLARSEAVKRGVSVSVCAAGNQNLNSCGTDWKQGWIIFVNPDENTTFANNTTEILIRTQSNSIQSLTISSVPTNSGIITFTSTGFVNSSTRDMQLNVSVTGCTGNHGRTLSLSPTGRPQLTPFSC